MDVRWQCHFRDNRFRYNGIIIGCMILPSISRQTALQRVDEQLEDWLMAEIENWVFCVINMIDPTEKVATFFLMCLSSIFFVPAKFWKFQQKNKNFILEISKINKTIFWKFPKFCRAKKAILFVPLKKSIAMYSWKLLITPNLGTFLMLTRGLMNPPMSFEVFVAFRSAL